MVTLVNPAAGTPFAVPIPNEPGLLGAAFCAQAGSTSGAQFQLTNALDCVIGN